MIARKNFTSADVAARVIAKSANRHTYKNAYNYRDVGKKAAKLGISFHQDKYGTSCYTAEEAERIREELIKDYEGKDNNLSLCKDDELVAELRRRGWNVKATKTTITEI